MNWIQEASAGHAAAPKYMYQRKNMALMLIAEKGGCSAARALAMLETGQVMTGAIEECIQYSMDAVLRAEDGAMIHFIFLLYLYQQYRNHLTDAQAAKMQNSALGFQYRPNEPGSEGKGGLGEEQALLFSAGQYLACRFFEQELSAKGGFFGLQQRDTEKEHLDRWFDHFLKSNDGMWNGAAGIHVILAGLFALYTMAPDPYIRHCAHLGLDKTFRLIAYSQFYGTMASGLGAAFEETLNEPQLLELSFLFWIVSGSGRMVASSQIAVLFALSSYEPPAWEKDVQVGRRQFALVEWASEFYHEKVYAYRTGSYLLSCARRFGLSANGPLPNSLYTSMGVRAAPFYIHHPAIKGKSNRLPCPIDGTMILVRQYKALQMLLFRQCPNGPDICMHAHAPVSLYDEINIDGKWFFARVEDAYLAVCFSSPFHLNTSGSFLGDELSCPGPEQKVIVRMGSEAEFVDFQQFIRCMLSAELSFMELDRVTFRDPAYGLLCLHMSGDLALNGLALPDYTAQDPNVEIGFLGLARSCASFAKIGNVIGPKPKMIIFMDSGDTLIDEGTELRDSSGIVYHAELFKGAGEALKALYDQGHTIALVADGETQSFVNIYNENGLGGCFAKRVISEEVGEQKPSGSMFQAAMRALNLCDDDKRRIVMIGNNILKDIAGANRFGIHSILVNRSPRYVMAPSSAEQEADFVIKELFELPGIIAWMEEHLL